MSSNDPGTSDPDDVEFGVTGDGFTRKYPADIIDSLLVEARKNFDNRDLNKGAPHRELLDLGAYEHGAQWEALQVVWESMGLDTAEGPALDHLLAFAGVYRRPRKPATGEAKFTVTGPSPASTEIQIERGTTVTTQATSDTPAIPFKTTALATIPEGGSSVDRVPIRGLHPWEANIDEKWLGESTNVDAGTIREFENPIGGLAVTNPLPTGSEGTRTDGSTYNFSLGRDRESDEAFRTRYKNNLALGGQASLDAIRSAVANVEGVTTAGIQEVIDVDTNGFRLTVVGNYANQDVADMITATRSAGIESLGAIAVTTTVDGDTYTERFDDGTEVTVTVDLAFKHDGLFPSDGETQIKDAIIRYIGGIDSNGIKHPGVLDIGEDVITDEVRSAAMFIDGVWRVTSLTLGPSTKVDVDGDITIASNEVATTSASNITLTPTPEERS